VDRFISRVVISVAVALAAVVLVALALSFLGGALYLFLISISVAPALAALVVGLTGLAAAAMVILAAHMTAQCGRASRAGGRSDPAEPGAADNVSDLASQLGSLAARELTAQTQAHPYRAFAVALLAGLAVGGSPELRDMLKKMLLES
jgi:hypothetical protein